MMFDFYGMPADWPGRHDASARPARERGEFVETALLEDLARHASPGFNRKLFIPYVQMHEFEALLFSNVDTLCMTLSPLCKCGKDDLSSALDRVLAEAGEPEAINDRPECAPSKRILTEVPGYRKVLYGPLVATRIGIEAIRGMCPHFHSWLERLESIER
jgi:hypothetical protein